MTNSFRNITTLGINHCYNEDERRKTLIINQVCLGTIFFMLWGSAILVFSNASNINILIASVTILLPVITIILNAKGFLRIAKNYTIIIFSLLITCYTIFYGTAPRFHFYQLALAPLPMIIFGAKDFAARFTYTVFIILSWAICEVYIVKYALLPLPEPSIYFFKILNILICFGMLVLTINHYVRSNYGHLKKIQKTNDELLNVTLNNKVLNELNSELDQYSSIITHDLKSPLTNIKSLVSLLRSQQKNIDEKTQEIIGHIDKCTNQMDKLIVSVLNYTKSVNPKAELENFSVEDVLQNIDTLLGHKLKVNYHIDSQSESLYGNSTQLQQVLFNLIDNALAHVTKKDLYLSVTVNSPVNEFVKFEVTDNGEGIGQEMQKKIFEFLHSSSKGSNKNFGIGLAIVRKLVLLNKGDFGLDSELGKGSTFWFTWPVVACTKNSYQLS